MTNSTSQIVALFVAAGVGAWMALAGVHKSALEWRKRRHRCPSCGRYVDGRTCGCHGS